MNAVTHDVGEYERALERFLGGLGLTLARDFDPIDPESAASASHIASLVKRVG